MRLDRVFIHGFKNLKNFTIDFDEDRLTTVIIGQNGTGKSNLVEAIVDVFRYVNLDRGVPRFQYEVKYRIGPHHVELTNCNGKPRIIADGSELSRPDFHRQRHEYFPDLIFGYYSGGSRRLESLFDSHQRRYYDAIKLNDEEEECRTALEERRLFYCRPIHGVFALLACFAFPDPVVDKLLHDKLGVIGFHSALAVLRRPWFAKGRKTLDAAHELWGAKGPAGRCAAHLRKVAFHPLAASSQAIDDYRDKGGQEHQLGLFLRDKEVLLSFAKNYSDDRELFTALEAMDISDLIRDLHVWTARTNDETGDISFADLSDGERQLLMVLGLIRISRGRRALFLLDEPDTHLNPAWQHTYLDLIRDWTGVASDASNCHIVLTSHNPLTIAALKKEEVRVMFVEDDGRVTASQPYADPQGMGFTATLTEIFGLPTSLDPATQRIVDDRNALARIDQRSEEQEKQLIKINDQLSRLGFMFESREPLYQDFLRAWQDVRYGDTPLLNQTQIADRHRAMKLVINRLRRRERDEAS